jgi:hypothetical protein
MPTRWTQAPLPRAAARAEFDADVTYLDTATFGLRIAPAEVPAGHLRL